MIFFTICSRNFSGYALTLWSSLREHYPKLQFYMALCDLSDEFDLHAFPFPVITLDNLGIEKFDAMKKNYNITELNTSIKPFVFHYLFDLHPGEMVAYFDPDIFVFSRLDELDALADGQADCVLTPHICEPAEHAEMSDRAFLKYGIYNLGFCALRDTPDVRRVVAWWARRLEDHCTIDLSNGLFVDQKWADYLPAFIARTSILRHPGYNVAYWNLAQRRLQYTQDGWRVNGEPLRFFHFSGNRIDDENTFTRHARQFTVENTPELVDLLKLYRVNIFGNGHKYYSAIPYAFSWNGAFGKNEHTPEAKRRADRDRKSLAPHLPLMPVYSFEQFQFERDRLAGVIASRVQKEHGDIPKDSSVFHLRGFCSWCKESRPFVTSPAYSSRKLEDGRTIPNWREHLTCKVCGLPNRLRASMQIFENMSRPASDDRIYLTERVTTTYKLLETRFSNLEGSEYFGAEHSGGDIVNGVRHEDIQKLSYPDDSFKHILTFDVLEHVPFPIQACREFFRCLSPGGTILITVPFAGNHANSIVRARLESTGEIHHILEPEYHGNPVDMENGALCFQYLAWDFLDDLRSIGFVDVAVLCYWSDSLKYYGDPQFQIFARKPDQRIILKSDFVIDHTAGRA